MVNRTVVARANALLRGEGRERRCNASAVEQRDRAHSYAAPPIQILDPDDNFPDGDYELVLGNQRFRMVKRDGKYFNTL